MVAGSVTSRLDELRVRDRRHGVRDPDESQIAVPMEKTLWGEPVHRKTKAAAEPASEPERVEPHPGEYFGSIPEARRGRGLFRR
jgi:hypothetical protein